MAPAEELLVSSGDGQRADTRLEYARGLLEMLVPHLGHGDSAGGYEYWISEREADVPGLRVAIATVARAALRSAEPHLLCSAIQALGATGDDVDVPLISCFSEHQAPNVADDVVATLRQIRHRQLLASPEELFCYPTDSFEFVKKTALSVHHFNTYPIWAVYDTFDDRDLMAEWGIDRKWIDDTLDNWNKGYDDLCFPVLRPYPFLVYNGYMVKARFVTAGGESLTGFVDKSSSYDHFAVFYNGERLDFWIGNHWISDRIAIDFAKNCERLRHLVNRPDDPLFPIHFETDILDHYDRKISGTLG